MRRTVFGISIFVLVLAIGCSGGDAGSDASSDGTDMRSGTDRSRTVPSEVATTDSGTPDPTDNLPELVPAEVTSENVCNPQCQGIECGEDGCGGSCGTCGDGEHCKSGQCICKPNCHGKKCGDNGCGGSCGTCEEPEVCVDGLCCSPECQDKECGEDGFGCNCGECEGEQDICLDGICQCQPNCEGMECGDDGCDGTCGVCQGEKELCTDGQCVCQPDCDGQECGKDGCGGSCGQCDEQSVCLDGSCCTPDCEGLQCGDDGCGGDCGACDGQSVCLDGTCCTPDCEGLECGGDVCGGSCGECTGPQDACIEGACVCQPACVGLECGDDGCEGTCGQCDSDSTCVTGTCYVTAEQIWVAADNVGDPLADGSAENPFGQISDALEVAEPNVLIAVLPGLYDGSLLVETPGVTVRGTSAEQSAVVKSVGDDVGITVQADNVQLENLMVAGGGTGVFVEGTADAPLTGVKLLNVTIKESGTEFHSLDLGDTGTLYMGFGLMVIHTNGLSIQQTAIHTLESTTNLAGLAVLNSESCEIGDLTVFDVGSPSQPNTMLPIYFPFFSELPFLSVTGVLLFDVQDCNVIATDISAVRGGTSVLEVLGATAGFTVYESQDIALTDLSVSDVATCDGAVEIWGSDVWDDPGGSSAGLWVRSSPGVSVDGLMLSNINGGKGAKAVQPIQPPWVDPLQYATSGGNAYGVLCNGSELTVQNALVNDIQGGPGDKTSPGPPAENGTGTGMAMWGSSAGSISNATIVHTDVGISASGPVQATNLIIATAPDGCVDGPEMTVAYANIYGCGSLAAQTAKELHECFYAHPKFVDYYFDFHLEPYSPAIDAGHPTTDCSLEPEPNGCRINLGAYGGTAEARSATQAEHCESCPECSDNLCGGTCPNSCAPDTTCFWGRCCAASCTGNECGDDGCGGSCGVCEEAAICIEGSCCSPNCEGLECGDDGCGGSCGTCEGAQDLCVEGLCVCQPNCSVKDCGDDGCGENCGVCPANEFCSQGSEFSACLTPVAQPECDAAPDQCGYIVGTVAHKYELWWFGDYSVFEGPSPGVPVEASNVATGVTAQAITDNEGRFAFQVGAGDWEVTTPATCCNAYDYEFCADIFPFDCEGDVETVVVLPTSTADVTLTTTGWESVI